MKVSFLIIGAQKSGTSALAHFLTQHPEIVMAEKKEVHFFNKPEKFAGLSKEQMIELYHSNFPEFCDTDIIGEATPAYMFSPSIPSLVRDYNPDMKLICLLRDPVERAWSQYLMERKRDFEKNGFWYSVLSEYIRYFNDRENYSLLNKNEPVRRFCYIERGLYSRQIERWLKYFPESQLLILRTKDLLSNHEDTLKRVYRFLNVKDTDSIPKQETVFSHNDYKKIDILSQYLLNACFFFEKRRLRLKFNISDL